MSAPDINSIDDEDELHKLLTQTEDFEQRKKIRARMKDVREKKAAAWEAQRAASASQRGESAVEMKQRQADAARKKALQDLDSKAEEKRTSDKVSVREEGIKQRHANAAAEKQQQMKALQDKASYIKEAYSAGQDLVKKHVDGKPGTTEETSSRTTKTETGKDGSTTTTTTTTTTKKTQGQTGGAARPNFLGAPAGGAGGADTGSTAAAGGGGLVRSPSAIKQMLLEWTKQQTTGYAHVEIKNFSSSWNDGMAFCALIHSFYPKAFDYSKLDPKRRRANFTLAFNVADKLADIAPLLDVDDMVRMKNPDWKCVFTYVQSFYRRFRMQENKNPGSPVTPTTPHTPLSPEPIAQ